MANLKIDLEQDEVFVFTPKGEVVTLPVGRHADRLRLRHPHRGRPRAASAPRSTAGSSPLDRRCARATPSRSSRRKVEGAGPVAATGCRSSPRRGPASRSASGSRGSAARTPSRSGRDELVKALRREGLPVQKLQSGSVLPDDGRRPELRRPRRPLRGRSASTTSRPRRSPPGSAQALRDGGPSTRSSCRPPSASRAGGATDRGHRRRARRGPRRRAGAAVALLHAGARRRDHGLRHPGPGRVGAPGRLRQRRVAGSAGQGDRLIEVEWDSDRRGDVRRRRSRSRRSTGPGCCGTWPRRSPTTTSTSSPARRRPAPTGSSKMRFDFELGDPSHLESLLATIQRIDSRLRRLPGRCPARATERTVAVVRRHPSIAADADGRVRGGHRAASLAGHECAPHVARAARPSATAGSSSKPFAPIGTQDVLPPESARWRA